MASGRTGPTSWATRGDPVPENGILWGSCDVEMGGDFLDRNGARHHFHQRIFFRLAISVIFGRCSVKEDDWSGQNGLQKRIHRSKIEDGWEIHGGLFMELRDPEGRSKEYPLVIWDGIVLEFLRDDFQW